MSLDTRFADLERALDARAAGREASKRGPQGKPGLAAPPITAWKVDRERYRAVPFYSDGKPGPAIELRDLFAQFLNETSWSK